MGHKYDVPRLWTEQMGAVVAKQDERAAGAYVTGQSLVQMRQAYRTERAFWNEGGPSVASSTDRQVPTRYGQVRVRHYRPDAQGPSPLIVFVHGGGWVIGDVDTHDRITRTLCHLTGAAVVSVDYTLAPEARFPQQIHECRDVVVHIREHAGTSPSPGTPPGPTWRRRRCSCCATRACSPLRARCSCSTAPTG